VFAKWISEIARETTSFAWTFLHSLIDSGFEFFSNRSEMGDSGTLMEMASTVAVPQREREKDLIVDRTSTPIGRHYRFPNHILFIYVSFGFVSYEK
jgi:hypothetical protein